jgi:NAD(P)H-dependent flavin oxidoreductase YrpB (nitropropane dioxygenase family)
VSSSRLLAALGTDSPVIAAPMAGGPTTPDLVIAAARAGALGFLAGGYLTAERLAADIAAVRAAGTPFAVNLFAPNPVPVDRAAFRDYAARLQADADRYDVTLDLANPREDDDQWREKLEVLRRDPVPAASFTFGLPTVAEIKQLQNAGTLVIQTVTCAEEASAAADAGVDALAVQSSAAGGHWGTLTPASPPTQLPLHELLRAVRAAVALPLIAAGGIATPEAVTAALAAGADAAAVGTALLLAPEAGTSAPYRAALTDPSRTETVQTRAFTGRPARGLRNAFIDRYDAHAPLGYPALHHLTRPLRRAAAAAGDPELINLWAGAGHRSVVAEAAAATLTRLAARA